MSKPQKSLQASLFVDYIPAELRENAIWEVVYWVKNPFTGNLSRKRNRVKPLKSITERRKLGRAMVKNINSKLQAGWNPFKTEENAAIFKELIPEMELFIKRKQAEFKKGDLRIDTLRTYRSFTNNIKNYIIDNYHLNLTIYDFNTHFITEFLDFVYYEKENSARTRNNYLGFIITLMAYFKKKKFIGVNPAEEINYINLSKKDKPIIPKTVRKQIFTHLLANNKPYLTLCLACYYCMIRRTELTKIKVKDIVLVRSIIHIKNEYSKNKRTQAVTIPNNYMPFLTDHLKKANLEDYLFSDNQFIPGPNKLNPKRISDLWSVLRKELKFDKKIIWYHLKDTGITDLLASGVPTIKVRDQARHHSIAQTEEYTPKEILKADSDIQFNDLNF